MTPTYRALNNCRAFSIGLIIGTTLLFGCDSGGSNTTGDSTTPDAITPSEIASSSDTNTESTATPESNTDSVPVMPPLLELEISRDQNGNINIDNVESIPSVIGAYRPWSTLEGNLAAVAYQNDRVVDATLISFTAELSVAINESSEVVNASSIQDGAEIELSNVIVHIDATQAIDRIDVVNPQGVVLASHDNTLTSNLRNVMNRNKPFSNQPWIRLLSLSDTKNLPAYLANESIDFMSTQEIATIQKALNDMPLRLKQSISSIGILEEPGVDFFGYAFDATIYLKREQTSPLYRMTGTLTHEAGHTYGELSVELANFISDVSQWPEPIRIALVKTHEDLGLDAFDSVIDLWAELHENAVENDLASEYGTPGVTDLNAYEKGFTTGYSSETVKEDFADTVRVANIYAMSDSTALIRGDAKAHICREFQSAAILEKEMALAYIKLQLVVAMELADPTSVSDCVGQMAPTTTPGIDFPVGTSTRQDTPALDYTFNKEMNAGYTSESRDKFIIVAQDSSDHGIGIEIDTDGGVPEGVHSLEDTWWNWKNLYYENALYVAPFGEREEGHARTAAQGVVVITFAQSGARVDGFIMNLVLKDSLGGSYTYKFVPFRIPL